MSEQNMINKIMKKSLEFNVDIFFKNFEKRKSLLRENADFFLNGYTIKDIFKQTLFMTCVASAPCLLVALFCSLYFNEYSVFKYIFEALGFFYVAFLAQSFWHRPKALKVQQELSDIDKNFKQLSEDNKMAILKKLLSYVNSKTLEDEFDKLIELVDKEGIGHKFCTRLNHFFTLVEKEKVQSKKDERKNEIKEKLGIFQKQPQEFKIAQKYQMLL